MRIGLGAVLAGVLCGAAWAGPQGVDADKLVLPLEGEKADAAILSAPSGDEMARSYPPIAMAMRMTGQVVLRCIAGPDNRLHDCKVDRESPEGLGFGAAAIRLAPDFVVRPPTFNGRPVANRFSFPIRFQLGDTVQGPAAESIPAPTAPGALILARQVVDREGDSDRLRVATAAYLRGLNGYVVATGDGALGEKVADAYREGFDDVIADEMDRRSRLIAATMTAEQLRATLAFFKTPAGAAFLQAQARIQDPKRADLGPRVAVAARARLCQKTACPTSAP